MPIMDQLGQVTDPSAIASDELNMLTMSRKYVRQRATKVCQKVHTQLDTFTEEQRMVISDTLMSLRNELSALNKSMFPLYLKTNMTESRMDQMVGEEERYDDSLLGAMARLRSTQTVSAANVSQTSNGESRTGAVGSQKLKLPRIPLPEFSNAKNQSLQKFIRSFESIISKHNITSHEKFMYLKGQLSEGPKSLIESLDVDQQSYETAKELLEKAFDRKVNSKHDLIKEMCELKLALDADPYSFIGDMRTIIAGFDSLKITVPDVLQYFIWNSLNVDFQNHLTNITNKSKPELADINEHIFEATERYLKQTESKKLRSRDKTETRSKNETLNMAINVKQKTKAFCALCHGDSAEKSHELRNCPIYNTPSKRISKLKSIKACTKCGFINHDTTQCKFKFSSMCRKCGGAHMSFLCSSGGSSVGGNNGRRPVSSNVVETVDDTTNNLSMVEMKQSCTDGSIILPTLTAELLGTEGQTVTIRTFIDGGCQKNFITSELANKMKFQIVKSNVPLKIHGFNSSRNMTTDVVEVTVRLGSDSHIIEAICIGKIKTKFRVSNIHEVINSFSAKGYGMADKDLECCSDFVGDFGLILGAESNHIIPMQFTKLGVNSVFIDTPHGVILTGDLDNLRSNVRFLETRTEMSSFAVNLNIFDDSRLDEQNDDYSIVYGDSSPTVAAQCDGVIDSIDEVIEDEIETETNKKLISFVLENTKRQPNGRLIMPLTWNIKNSHLLGKNYNLSLKILRSTFTKLKNDPMKLRLYDDVFKEQEELGIIERIENLEEFLREHPEHSFLPHMGVFKMSRESTKCRIVSLSNLSENLPDQPLTVSHNQAILPGPNLNHKILTALVMLRFDPYLLVFDIKKAFLSVALNDFDQNRLMFLWYRDVTNGDYSLVAYKSLRLSFGLRCSPAILMLALYRILILDSHGDEKVKHLTEAVYNSIYMDNGSYSCADPSLLTWAIDELVKIFGKYQFSLQQFATNSAEVQAHIDERTGTDSNFDQDVKLFGMHWNRSNDSLVPIKINLDMNANTRRTILSSLNTVYDVFGLYIPMLLRARLFVQRLQSDKTLTWDTTLTDALCKEWVNICKQTNTIPRVYIGRFVGERSSVYELVAFTDSSRNAGGSVIYLKDTSTGSVSFLSANSKLFGENLRLKSIPCLEFCAVSMGVEHLMDTRDALCGDSVVIPVKITKMTLFTDSMVCLHWLNSYVNKFDKLQRISVLVKNKLRKIDELCTRFPVEFRHTAGRDNPADCTTKPYSHKCLVKTSYYSGPEFLSECAESLDDLVIMVPNPDVLAVDEVATELTASAVDTAIPLPRPCSPPPAADLTPFVPVTKYSSLKFLVNVHKYILLFVNKLKQSLNSKSNSNSKLQCQTEYLYGTAMNLVISRDQREHFPEVFSYLESSSLKRDLPPLMSRMNLYLDSYSVLRVKSKFAHASREYHPILLAKNSHLTGLIISDVHNKLAHSGLYSVLRQLRKEFYVIHYYSVVRKVLKACITCKRLNERAVKLNQSSYRKFRYDPNTRVFSDVYLDYIGPFVVKLQNRNVKVWVLIITCLWSRAINLKICMSANLHDFLRGVQLHIYDHGLFTFCVSDLGSQIQAGTNMIKSFLNDEDAKEFLEISGIRCVEFDNYPKGNSSLGSVVEICVKQVKHLVQKSVRTVILDYFEFEFLISKAVNIINKRPIAFKDSLRNLQPDELPQVISPEMLIRGYETPGINVVPGMQVLTDDDPSDSYTDLPPVAVDRFSKLNRVKSRLLEIYHGEFIGTLIAQAIDKPDRYRSVPHKSLSVGDLVLLIEKNSKRYLYPMGRVLDVEINDLGEVTAAHVMKGATREKVYRHATSLIPLLSAPVEGEIAEENEVPDSPDVRKRPLRSHARKARDKIEKLSRANLV